MDTDAARTAAERLPLLVVLNPAAGRGLARSARGRIRRWLADQGHDYSWHETEAPGHAAEIARGASHLEWGRIVLVGGDGTVSDVAPGLADRSDAPPLALVPAGTGNDTAKTLGVARLGLEASLEAAVSGRVIRIDAGRVNGRIFVNNFGAGFDGEVAQRSRRFPWIRGMVPYLLGFGMTLPGWQAFEFEAHLDGEALEGGATLVTFANGQFGGGGFRLTPRAEPDDGKMDACIVGPHGRLAILYHLPKAITGRHVNEPGTTYRQVRQVAIRFSRPIEGHVDGNLIPGLEHAVVEVLPGAIAAVSTR